jgi:hypothetical protein
MLKSLAFKSAAIAAAGAAALFFSPALAQASTASTAAPATEPIIITYFTTLTYPDTSAGLLSCEEQGAGLVAESDGEDLNYNCELGDPDAGVYNLWIAYWNPSYCRTC